MHAVETRKNNNFPNHRCENVKFRIFSVWSKFSDIQAQISAEKLVSKQSIFVLPTDSSVYFVRRRKSILKQHCLLTL